MNFRLSSRFSAWPLSTTGYGVLIEPVLGQRCAHSGDVYDWSWSARRVLGWVLNLKDLAIEGVFLARAPLGNPREPLSRAEDGAYYVTCEMPVAKVEN